MATTNLRNNQKWQLVQYPKGNFEATRDAKLVEETIDLEKINFDNNPDDELSLEPDMVVIAVDALSIDAFVRTMMDEGAFHGSIKPGSTIPAIGYGTVLKAGPLSKLKKGSKVSGLMSASSIAFVKSSTVQATAQFPYMKPSLSLGYMGVSGLTAYVGMFVSPREYPQQGETVVVSAAAGAVGSIACQMAKLCGSKVIGIAGGSKKKDFLMNELGLDGAVDYKDKDKSIGEQLDELCPDGIDFFFDNVGGPTLDAVLEKINLNSRIVVCGAISQYSDGTINKKGAVVGPSNYVKLAEKSSSMSGFVLTDYMKGKYLVQAISYLLWHYYRGNIQPHEHVEDGIEYFAPSLEKMFSGSEHCGRLVIDVSGSLKPEG
uniref:Enoyl reductase (ER) domain-containing protein n=1 Tax=Helicotheca tamesis TaxID=374047 RepID=A0A7S2MG65_9STRA